MAGYGPETVELVEAHGTGTAVGDEAEIAALARMFGDGGAGARWCAVGSVKSQVGHTKCAAGLAGLIKVAKALHHKVLPPTIKVDRPHPTLGVEDSPFYLATGARRVVIVSGILTAEDPEAYAKECAAMLRA